MRRPDIPVLTSLRFPAALAIFCYHGCWRMGVPRWMWGGLDAGVSFFYVLSGFILFYNYFDLTDRTGFWVARLARIWPVHLATLGLLFALIPWRDLWGHEHWPVLVPMNVFLLEAWLPFRKSALSFNAVAWSLSAEAFFYFLFPWLSRGLKRWGPAPVLFLPFALGAGIVIAVQQGCPAQADTITQYNPACRLFEFVLGIATCHFWLRERSHPRATTWWEGAILGLVLVTLMTVGQHYLTSHAPLFNWLTREVCAVEFALLIWIFAHQAGAFSRVLSGGRFVFLGQISFAMYMCHQILLRLYPPERAGTLAGGLAVLGLWLLATLVLSWTLFHWVEMPMRHRIVEAFRARRR